VIYADRATSKTALRSTCNALRDALATHDLEVHCPSMEHTMATRTTFTTVNAANNSTTTANNYVWQFNLFLWIPIGFIVVLIAVLWAFTTAGNERDTILYRSTRHKGD